MSNSALPLGEQPLSAVLDRLKAKRESALPTRMQRIGRESSSFPLSDGQERLWLIDQMQPGNSAYHITAAVQFEGLLDPAALSAAMAEILRRHETLRTSFHSREGIPVQVIAPAAALPLRRVHEWEVQVAKSPLD